MTPIYRNLSLMLSMTALLGACSGSSDSSDDTPGAGGSVSSGAGGSVASATGGSASPGAGGSVTPGAGGGPIVVRGNGGSVTASGGAPGAGGSASGSGGAPVTSTGGTTSSGGAAGTPNGGVGGVTNPAAGGASGAGAGTGIHHEDNPSAMSAAAKGPFATTSYTMGLPDSPDYGTATVVYPMDADPPLSIIAAVPGFASPGSVMKAWSDFLATHGFAVIWVDTNSTNDQPPARSKAQLSALATLKAENTRQGGPLMGKLDTTRSGVMGHSMGGGGTLISTTKDMTLKAAMPLAPWCSGTGCNFATDTIPTLMFTGQNDTTAPPAQHGNVFYGQIPATTPKIIAEISGANHGTPLSVTANTGMKTLGVSFLKVYVDGDDRYKPFLQKSSDFSNYMSSP
jgi:dienelactone hydrolase